MPLNRIIVCCFALLAATCLFVVWNLSTQGEITNWVDHSDLVIRQSQELLALFLDAETGQRGFLVTGAERYLKPYYIAQAALPGSRSQLRSLTRESPVQQQRLDRLDVLGNTKLSELAESIHLYRHHGFDAARAVILTDRGRNSMIGIRSILAQIQSEEKDRLSERIRGLHRKSLNIAVGASLFTASLALFLFISTRQERTRSDEKIALDRVAQELRIMHDLLERAPIGILMLDRCLIPLGVSQCWLEDFGVAREEVLGRNLYETLPNQPQQWLEFHRRGLAGEALSGKEDSLFGPDGSEHWINWHIAPWGDDGEHTGGIVIYSDDVTKRKRAESALAVSESRYRGLFEQMNQGVALCQVVPSQDLTRPDFVYLAVNSKFGLLTGLHDVVGKTITQILPQIHEVDPELIDTYMAVARTGVPQRFERYVSALEQWHSFSVFSPESGVFVVVFDAIDARKKADFAALLWQTAFEECQSGIALVDVVAGKFSAVNPAFSRAVGYTTEELAGQDITFLYPASELEDRLAVLRDAEAESGHVLFETSQIRKDGTHFPVLIDITVIRDEDGKPISHVKIVHDLTEMKRAAEALRASEARALSLFENASQGILTINAQGRIVDANAMAGRLFGYVDSELLGAPIRMLLPESLRQQHATRRQRELVALRKDGTEFPVEVSVSYVEENRDQLSIAFVSDITERKKVDAALRDSEAQFRTLANAIPHLCWIANADGWIFWYNQRWYDFTGATSEQMEGWGWKSVHEPSCLPEVMIRWTQSITSGTSFEMVFPLRGADGTFHMFLTRSTPVTNSEGKVIRWFGTNTDISEQLTTEEALRARTQQLEAANDHLKRTSHALRTSEGRVRSLYENAGQGILTAEAAGSIVDANAMVLRTFGYTSAELIGAPIEMLLPKSPRAEEDDVPGLDSVAIRKDGTEFPVEISRSYFADQQVGLSMVFVSDITARKAADREREGLILELEDALSEKTVLLQEVHHRVKNNLAVVGALLGMQASTLEEGPAIEALEESQRRVLSMARIHEFLYSTDHLDRIAFGKYVDQLANELLDSYTLDPGAVTIRITADDIDLPVDQAIPCGLILNELLTNSLKYAFPGGRTGEIKVNFIRLESGQLSLTCSDNGVGIPEDFKWQEAKSLGLRIIRILTNQISGELTLDRMDGESGTRFELKFPPSTSKA